MHARLPAAVAVFALALAVGRADEPKKELVPPTFTAPKGWTALEKLDLDERLGIFGRFRAGDGNDAPNVIVGAMGGDADTVLIANVGRWRAQLKLESLDNKAARKALAPVKVDGKDAYLLDITGTNFMNKDERIVAVLVPHDKQTVYAKLSGPPTAVGEQKKAFDEFVKSIRLPK